jgi:hypothetical protein
VDDILSQGTRKMRLVASETIESVRQAMGLPAHLYTQMLFEAPKAGQESKSVKGLAFV